MTRPGESKLPPVRWIIMTGRLFVVLALLLACAAPAFAGDLPTCSQARWRVDLREWRALAPTCAGTDEAAGRDALALPVPPAEVAGADDVQWLVAAKDRLLVDQLVRDGAGAVTRELRAVDASGATVWTVRLEQAASVPVYAAGAVYVLAAAAGRVELVEYALDSGRRVRALLLPGDDQPSDPRHATLREEAAGLLAVEARLCPLG